MHALTFRAWKNRLKGRDWYDFEWYVRNRVADINAVKADVIPYIIDKRELDIWSNDYFLQLADMIVFL